MWLIYVGAYNDDFPTNVTEILPRGPDLRYGDKEYGSHQEKYPGVLLWNIGPMWKTPPPPHLV